MKPWHAILILTFVSLYGDIGFGLLGTWLVEPLKATCLPTGGTDLSGRAGPRPKKRRPLKAMIALFPLARNGPWRGNSSLERF